MGGGLCARAQRPGGAWPWSPPAPAQPITVTPVRDSMADSVPIVVICGQCADDGDRYGCISKKRPVPSIMGAVAKHVFLDHRPHQAGSHRAPPPSRFARTGRPGPVVLDVPKDVQNWKGVFHGSGRLGDTGLPPADEQAGGRQAAGACLRGFFFFAALGAANRPLILCRRRA